MKNDICIAKINHLKVMNGLPMPIKALFLTGIRFSGVKIPCVHLLIMSRKTSS